MSATSDRNSRLAEGTAVGRRARVEFAAAAAAAWLPPGARGAESWPGVARGLLPDPLEGARFTPAPSRPPAVGAVAAEDADARACLGLRRWNAYLRTGDASARAEVLAHAEWLTQKQVVLPAGGAGWPHATADPRYYAYTPWLSATTQAR